MELRTDTNYKELEIILSSFDCDKNCPYCTAKITKWDVVEDDIYLLSMYVGQMKEMGYTFHYVTIGGNGEPTKHNYQKLKDIVEMFDDWDIPVKRVLTSGNIFRKEEINKYNLFINHGWIFEVTTTSIDNDIDRETLGYNHNYFETDAFKNAHVRLNYVLLNRNRDKYITEIQQFLDKYPNIDTVALKLLNINTKTNKVDNPLSQWIYDNAVPKTDREKIAEELNSVFKYNGEAFDTFSWLTESNREVYFSWKKLKYGLYDIVYYGNKFVTYQLDEIKLDKLVPKVYVAARFVKDRLENGELSLNNDFRVNLINDHNNFMNFNNHSFIRDSNGNIKFQYLGPFYNEKASYGDVTSTDCAEVVNTENKLIERCDIFICYLDKNISPGGISELMYAALLGKRIIIYFKEEKDIGYSIKTSNWYPIVFAMIKGAQTEVYPVRRALEVVQSIKDKIYKCNTEIKES